MTDAMKKNHDVASSRRKGQHLAAWRTRRRLLLVAAGLAAAIAITTAGVAVASSSGYTAARQPAPVPSGWPSAKAAVFRAADQRRLAAAARPFVPVPDFTPQASLQAGIVELRRGGPFNPQQFQGTNLWNGPVGGSWEVVQAGGVPDPATGTTTAAVYVYTRSADPSSPQQPVIQGTFEPGTTVGGLFTVQAVSGNLLTLTLSGSTAVYHFDITTLTFV